MSATDPSSPPTPVADRPRAVVVLGMHRSGTSAVAGCLQRLGVEFGPRLMPPTNANERGYYEHIDIVNLHDRLLLALGASWDDFDALPGQWWIDGARTGAYRAELLELVRRDFSAAALWGLKDPRLCRLLPWWESIWEEVGVAPVFLIVLRSPREIAASLVRREGFSAAKAYLLYLRHALEAERWTRGHPRVFLDFEAFLKDWAAALAPLQAALGTPWPCSAADAGTANERFIEPALRHTSPDASGERLPAWVERADAALHQGLSGAPEEMQRELDRLHALLADAATLYQPLALANAGDLRQQLSSVRDQAQWYEAEWQKARRRADATRKQLIEKREEVQKLKTRIIAKEEYQSYMRMDILSKKRKQGVLFGSAWVKRLWKWVRSGG